MAEQIAPSTELRKWFGHDPEKWRSFRERYQTELTHHADQLGLINSEMKAGVVTLVYGARDQVHNEAVVRKQFLENTAHSHLLPIKSHEEKCWPTPLSQGQSNCCILFGAKMVHGEWQCLNDWIISLPLLSPPCCQRSFRFSAPSSQALAVTFHFACSDPQQPHLIITMHAPLLSWDDFGARQRGVNRSISFIGPLPRQPGLGWDLAWRNRSGCTRACGCVQMILPLSSTIRIPTFNYPHS